jgi:hypothetical protein
MAHSHYVMDLYYQDAGARDLRREVLRITAADDDEAIAEATRIFGWRNPVKYDVRAITKSARTGHRVVTSFTAPIVEEVPEPATEPDTDQPRDTAP